MPVYPHEILPCIDCKGQVDQGFQDSDRWVDCDGSETEGFDKLAPAGEVGIPLVVAGMVHPDPLQVEMADFHGWQL
jgi:hypothetical protein